MRIVRALVGLIVLQASVAVGSVIHVDDDAPPGGDGSAWETACQDLQAALALAVAGDEVRIAQGVYRPAPPDGDRQIRFELGDGVTLRGGYAGVTHADPHERDWRVYETVLSGDLNGDDVRPFGNRTDNSFHVVMAAHHAIGVELEGVTIRGGYAAGSDYFNTRGAGLYVVNSDMTLQDCVIADNAASMDGGGYAMEGGGMYIVSSAEVTICRSEFRENFALNNGGGAYIKDASLTLWDCRFVENAAEAGGAIASWYGVQNIEGCSFEYNEAPGGGGALQCQNGTEAALYETRFTGNSCLDPGRGRGGAIINLEKYAIMQIDRCVFVDNAAGRGGGAVCNYAAGRMLITRSRFHQNTAPYGGALFNDNQYGPFDYTQEHTLANCLFTGNLAELAGGAVYSFNDVDTHLSNCTIAYNTAGAVGGGVVAQTGAECVTLIENTILDSNAPDQVYQEAHWGQLDVRYSCVTGGWDGVGNLNDEPHFRDPPGADGILGTADDWLALAGGSPCIDAGDPDSTWTGRDVDIVGRPRVRCAAVDMGAYESGFGDVDCNQSHDAADLNAFVDCLQGPEVLPACPNGTPFDGNNDGDVDLNDCQALQVEW